MHLIRKISSTGLQSSRADTLYDSRHALWVAVAIPAPPDRILRVPFRGTVRSAKRTVIQTCKQCGAINQSSVELCCFCSARLNPSAGPEENPVPNGSPSGTAVPKFSVTAAGASRTTGSLALQPEWRREVNQRLRSYRERRGHSGNGDSQTALEFAQANDEALSSATETESSDDYPAENGFTHAAQVQPRIHYDSQFDHEFDEATDAAVALDEDQYEDPLQATLAAAAARVESEASAPAAAAKKPEPFQHLLIDVSRPPEVEIAGPAMPDAAESAQVFPRHDSVLLPVADLSIRRRAAAVDAICLLLAFAVVLGAFAFFGGRLIASKLDAFVCGAILTLLYTQYFSLFTMMGGATPGMMLAGLRLVSFDGAAPEPRQLIRRSAGYLLSGGMAFLGFLWSFWDEDHLSWHDHISQTYITPIAPAEELSITGTESHQSHT
jgi:uncharacterized RDD family membrane protein YckC